ncbi:MAG: glutamine cyclotransferase [Acidobacteria bacterium]|nr:glutamine cyclotransferase [Acidobacteriota bacterium]
MSPAGRRGAASSTLALVALSCAGGGGAGAAAPAPVRVMPVRVLAALPHDPDAFTQGLAWVRGRLYESTGLYGRSTLRELDPATGRILRSVALAPGEFGEGLTEIGGRLVQLTWREERARLWTLPDLVPAGTLSYRGEGWGLASDGRELVQSDGSGVLVFRAADDLRPLRHLAVRRDGRAVPYLNELEWADGSLFANVWQSDEILRIDPRSGEVTGAWDASGLLEPSERARADVLNGIAWDPERRRFFLTGKLWPFLFVAELPEPPSVSP